MALKLPIPFPIFAPNLNPTPPHHHRPPTEIRFSRWNNANAEKFNERRRTLQQIEDDIRRQRRFDSATRISDNHDSATPSTASGDGFAGETFKSVGTPSSPSRPSIPGKKSKYSKNPNPNFDSHPAFRPLRQVRKSAMNELSVLPKANRDVNRKAEVRVGEDGVSYVIDGAPFEFKYSYTETPKSQPVKLREAPYAPFGPTTMPRPWTGRAPLPPSKKKLKEFDSFRLPPAHKKGVKPVQAPGPYLPGAGPKYVMSREEILGEPLTKEEIMELVEGCRRTKRQLNLGRDGLTHNMLDNIHAHWKRRRVCKIKCKGVCTVDMDNVREQLEERTGGKIIYSKGGVIFLFRGRNYNYRTRPRFPLMLWKPVTPVYPRLVQRVPEGLTLEEVTEMRKKGHKLIPICKLGKNGVYHSLAKHVREAFEECELVRINCQGMNGSDYRKIGAKLKDLVPCVLLSFAYEHILMWRGRDWKSSLPKLEKDLKETKKESEVKNATSVAASVEGEEVTTSTGSVNDGSPELLSTSTLSGSSEVMGIEESKDSSSMEFVEPRSSTTEVSNKINTFVTENISDVQNPVDDRLGVTSNTYCNTYCNGITSENSGSGETSLDNVESGLSMTTLGADTVIPNVDVRDAETKLDSFEEGSLANEQQQVTSEVVEDVSQQPTLNARCTEGVRSLLQQAVEGGLAIVLDEEDLDADVVYQRTLAFSQSAPPGPVFVRPRKMRLRKVVVENSEVRENDEQDAEDLAPKEMATISMKQGSGKKATKARRKKDFGEHLDNVVPQGSLRIDELAKLLA